MRCAKVLKRRTYRRPGWSAACGQQREREPGPSGPRDPRDDVNLERNVETRSAVHDRIRPASRVSTLPQVLAVLLLLQLICPLA